MIDSVVRTIDKLKPYPPLERGASRFCPNESSGGFYIRFGYSDGQRSTVKVIPTGCRRVVAGKRGQWLFLPSRLKRRLTEIVYAR